MQPLLGEVGHLVGFGIGGWQKLGSGGQWWGTAFPWGRWLARQESAWRSEQSRENTREMMDFRGWPPRVERRADR